MSDWCRIGQAAEIRRGLTTTNIYDALNRLNSVYDSRRTINYTYDKRDVELGT